MEITVLVKSRLGGGKVPATFDIEAGIITSFYKLDTVHTKWTEEWMRRHYAPYKGKGYAPIMGLKYQMVLDLVLQCRDGSRRDIQKKRQQAREGTQPIPGIAHWVHQYLVWRVDHWSTRGTYASPGRRVDLLEWLEANPPGHPPKPEVDLSYW